MGKIGDIDCDLVESLSIKILNEKSKDVRVLFFLAWSELRREKWDCLADVFTTLANLTEKNFDALYPEREKAKLQAFAWLSESRFADLCTIVKPASIHSDSLTRLSRSLDKLKIILANKFKDNTPFPNQFQKTVANWEKECGKPDQNNTNAAPDKRAANISSSPAESVLESPKQAQMLLRKTAQFLQEQEPFKPMGYRLMRLARWDILENIPPNIGGVTQLTAPAAQTRNLIGNLQQQQKWKELFKACETAFTSGANHFWLDLQRLSAQACERAGASYSAIREIIQEETICLIKRLPMLVSLHFTDGNPVADPQTEIWICELAGRKDQNNKEEKVFSQQSDSEEMGKARRLMKEGKAAQAIEFLQDSIKESTLSKSCFYKKLTIAEIMHKSSRADLAYMVLEELDDFISKRGLEIWEPQIALETWTLFHSVIRSRIGEKTTGLDLHNKLALITQKICRTDPSQAFAITQTLQKGGKA